ncbi:MAG: C39 family peptidase [Mycobacterium sp.]
MSATNASPPARRGGAVAAAARPTATSVGPRRLTLVGPSSNPVTVTAATSNAAAPLTLAPAVTAPATLVAAPSAPAIAGDTIYGKLSNSQYWEHQGPWNTCVLMSTAMVIGQLTGEMPEGDQIVAEAERTPSVFPNYASFIQKVKGVAVERTRNGMIYKEVNDEYVYYADSLQILYNHKITASATYYTNAQSVRALSDLESALDAGESVIVSINSKIRDTFVNPPGSYTGGTVSANHAVTVLAVNVTKRLVYINDTALDATKGNYLTLSYDDFVKAWKPGQYTLITASLDPANPPTGPAQWKLVA